MYGNILDLIRKTKEYHLFISHAWRYSADYYRLVNLLERAKKEGQISYVNYSVPKHDPLIDPNPEIGKRKLYELLKLQINPASIVIVLSGMYVQYSYWIQKEIDFAVEQNKPIIGIAPWAQQMIPKAVSDVSKEIIRWNTKPIINAIKTYSL